MSGCLSRADVTGLLQEWQAGDNDALAQVITLLYGDLRRLAAACFKGERDDHTLQPTALVHEVYQQILSAKPVFEDRMHFLRTACLMMRRLLVKHARARKALKRQDPGMGNDLFSEAYPDPDTLIEVHRALDSLAEKDPRLSHIVELRFFMGFSIDDIAQMLALSSRTIKREWSIAKVLLAHQLKGGLVSS